MFMETFKASKKALRPVETLERTPDLGAMGFDDVDDPRARSPL
jgi:hypothetical protein